MNFTSFFTGRYLVAPFWNCIDLNDAGTLSFEIFKSGDYYLEQVNAYIQRERQNIFQGTWMMNVYYREVAQCTIHSRSSELHFLTGGMKVIALISTFHMSWSVVVDGRVRKYSNAGYSVLL